ncbi:MAG: hypothetical protein MJK04_33190, partial [Psychrosphaera sp.]|nr:hypothetical protein [Psychrosphaera sp.]
FGNGAPIPEAAIGEAVSVILNRYDNIRISVTDLKSAGNSNPDGIVYTFKADDKLPLDGIEIIDANGRVFQLQGKKLTYVATYDGEAQSMQIPKRDGRRIYVQWRFDR